MRLLLLTFLLFSLHSFSITICYTSNFNLTQNFVPTSTGCGLINQNYNFNDVDEIELVVLNPNGSNWTKDVTGQTTINLQTIYTEIVLAIGDTGIPLVINIRYYKLGFFAGRCTISSKRLDVVSPNDVQFSVPDLCAGQNVNFSQFITQNPGGVFTEQINAITFNSNVIADLNGVPAAYYTPVYTKSLGGTANCVVSKVGDPFQVFDAPTVSWVGSVPDTVIDTDNIINLSSYVSSNGGTITISGAGVFQSGTNWIFDPTSAGVESATLHLSITSPNGCTEQDSNDKTIVILHNPGVPLTPLIDLNASGIDYSSFVGGIPFYPYYTHITNVTNLGDYINWIVTSSFAGDKSVCGNGDTLDYVIAQPLANTTYNWYSNQSGLITFLHSGLTHQEITPISSTYMEYSLFYAAENFLGVEGAKNKITIRVHPIPQNNDDILICHDGLDSTYRIPYNFDHVASNDFYVGADLDTTFVESMTNYNWYDSNDNFLGRGYTFDYSWTVGSKIEEFYFVRVDSSTEYTSQFGLDITLATNIYPITGCSCEAQDTGKFTLIKNPEASYSATPNGIFTYYDSVEYQNTSLYGNALIWTLGDGSTNTQQTFWNYYNQVGVYSTSLFVNDMYGCYDDTTVPNEIVILDPGTPPPPIINLDYSGIDYASWDANFIPNYNHPRDTLLFNSAGDSIRWIMTDTIASHKSVCGTGDTLEYYIADPITHDTYKWYSDASGILTYLHDGRQHQEITPITNTYNEYALYYSAVNFVSVEGPKNKIKIRVNPSYQNTNDVQVCHLGVDTTYYLPYNTDHIMNDSFYVDNDLDSAYLERITNYKWFDVFDNYLGRSYGLDYSWTQGQKAEDFYFVRVDSSNQALGRDFEFYKLTGAECEAQDTGRFRLIRNPIAKYYVSTTGTVAPGTAVQFIDQSEYSTSLSWDFGDATGTSVDAIQWHYYNPIGSFDLYQLVTDNYGCTDSNLDISLITVSDWTGVEENSFSYSIYPNPTFGLLKIATDLNVMKNEIYDLGGKLVFKTTENEIDLSHIPVGTYVLRTIASDRVVTNKVTVMK
jgi:hypothetical protein